MEGTDGVSEETQDLQSAPEGDLEPKLPQYANPRGESLGVRDNPFGVHGTGDTSGYGLLHREVRMPGQSPKPYGGWFDDCVDYLEEDLRGAGVDPLTAIDRVVVSHGELTIHVAREHLVTVAKALRDDQDLRFELCMGVSGVHYPHDTGQELHAVYHFISVTHNHNLRIETAAPEDDPKNPFHRGYLPWKQLARARSVRHDGHHLYRAPGSDPVPASRRLGRAPAA
ncbi:NADH dehydrogenase subunit C [Mobiluncus curtisii]|uniref:NADH dehydrogenase subunit C n=1 Tax=Mobiluncus curtisii TaxID=2051 RepID=A0A2X3B8T7_9ACTO|nr:NADH dehydrogenase subunit C [Mobiluncus curtisii]